MPGPEALPAIVIALKALVEVAGLFWLARAAVWLLSAGRADTNPVYLGLCFLTSPVDGLLRRVLPSSRSTGNRLGLGLAGLGLVWIAMVLAKARVFGVL